MGNRFIDNVAIKMFFSNLKGFSVRNLKYMKSFYNTYKEDDEYAQIPRKHRITLIQKVKDKEMRKWYMIRCLEEGWLDSILFTKWKRIYIVDKERQLNIIISI